MMGGEAAPRPCPLPDTREEPRWVGGGGERGRPQQSQESDAPACSQAFVHKQCHASGPFVTHMSPALPAVPAARKGTSRLLPRALLGPLFFVAQPPLPARAGARRPRVAEAAATAAAAEEDKMAAGPGAASSAPPGVARGRGEGEVSQCPRSRPA